MKTESERLAYAMKVRGIETPADLARMTGINESTVRSNVNGTRGFSKVRAELYARFLRVDPGWLQFGKGKSPTGEEIVAESEKADPAGSASTNPLISQIQPNQDVGRRLTALRESQKLTVAALAQKAQVEVAVLEMWERGDGVPTSDAIQRLERALDAPLSVEAEYPAFPEYARAEVRQDFDTSKIFPLERGVKDLPVYAAVRGSFDGELVDMVTWVEFEERPAYLVGVREAFGVLVQSDSMEPRYFANEVLLVNPNLVCRPGDFVVVELAGHKGIVKRLKKKSDDVVVLEQLNPHDVKEFKRSEIKAICKVVGTKSR